MEGYNGPARPLDTWIGERGWRLNVNHLKLARFKQMFPAAAKVDRIDARRPLDRMRLGEHLPPARRALQEVHAPTPENARLKRLMRRRRARVDEKSRVLARLQGDLRAVCPERFRRGVDGVGDVPMSSGTRRSGSMVRGRRPNALSRPLWRFTNYYQSNRSTPTPALLKGEMRTPSFVKPRPLPAVSRDTVRPP